jgi:predicted esterase
MKLLCSFAVFCALVLSGFAKPDATVYLPANGPTHCKVAVWLQGYRGYPGLIKEPYLQEIADRLGIAIVGFPATTELDDETQQWSEEPAADNAYIQERLRELAQRHHFDVDRVALFGFSQGAMVAADLCTRFPDRYAGAIIMSPGGITGPHPAETQQPRHKDLVFWVTCMADEHPANVNLTRAYATHLAALGSKVTKIEYPGIAKHTRPPDFQQRFPEWISAILGLR